MGRKTFPHWVYIIVLVVAAFLWWIFSPAKLPQKGRVVSVLDGDTIVLEGGWRVRYLGIDTPETRIFKDGEWVEIHQPQGEEAKEFNKKLVLGKIVKLEYDRVKKDRHGRLLAFVWVGSQLVNEELVRRGLAYVFFVYPNQKYWKRFVLSQEKAIKSGLGLWQNPGMISVEEERKWNGVNRAVEGSVCSVVSTGKAILLFLKCQKKDRRFVVLPYLYFGSYKLQKYLDAKKRHVVAIGKIRCNRYECKQVLFHPAQIFFMDDGDWDDV